MNPKRMRIAGLEALDSRLLDGLAFCATAYDVFDAIRASPHGIEELRLRSSPRAKKLLEEILPLAAFVQARYGPGCRLRIRWVGGNQGFDARIVYSGAVVERTRIPKRQYVEVTTAVQPTEHLVRQQLNAQGFAFAARGTRRDAKSKRIISIPVACEHSDQVAEFAALIRSRVAQKALKRYPASTSLLIHCDLGVVVLDDEWEEIVRAVRAALQIDQNCFREVVLVRQGSRVAIVAGRAGRRRRSNDQMQRTSAAQATDARR